MAIRPAAFNWVRWLPINPFLGQTTRGTSLINISLYNFVCLTTFLLTSPHPLKRSAETYNTSLWFDDDDGGDYVDDMALI